MLTELHGEPDFVKVLDFGVAKLLDDSDKRNTKMQPRSTQFIGTPVYMSPEQVLGQPVTAASDLYSLGLILYEMLTGRNPIPHESVASVVREHLDEAPIPFEALETLSPPMQKLVLRATRRNPRERFRTVKQFAQAMPLDGTVDSIERSRPSADVATAETLAGLAEETSEPDIFSGKNYLAPPEPEEEEADLSSDFLAPPPRTYKPTPTPRRAPSLRTDELDLDLDSVNRHRRRLEHKRRQTSSGTRKIDGGWEAREYWMRVVTYTGGALGAYWAFVLLGAMMHSQAGAVRWGAGLLMVVASVLWTAFSGTQAVGVDFGRRWMIPTAKNLMYLFVLVAALSLLWLPGQTAKGLSTQPTWFYKALPHVPPLTWFDALTAGIAGKLAGLFSYMANLLPY